MQHERHTPNTENRLTKIIKKRTPFEWKIKIIMKENDTKPTGHPIFEMEMNKIKSTRNMQSA